MQARIVIIEAARIFDAEVAAIVGVFARHGCGWGVLSNDPLWPGAAWPTREAIQAMIADQGPSHVHFATHADERGIHLRFTEGSTPSEMETSDVLGWDEVRAMSCWQGRVITTSACGSLAYADNFLGAGASAVVAPLDEELLWDRVCHFYRLFYTYVLSGRSLEAARQEALEHGGGYYREFERIGVVTAGRAAEER